MKTKYNNDMEQSEKIIIYQVFTRLFGNEEVRNAYNGSLQENLQTRL